MSERILVVDDEPSLTTTLRYALAKAGFQVQTAGDGPSALAAADRDPPDLVLLDVMLPGIDGFEVCRVMRRTMSAPIVMLTARDSEVDRVVGLEVGADDYVTKPFGMREVVARVRAHLRRQEMRRTAVGDAAGGEQSAEVLVVGGLEIDVAGRHARLDGRPLPLKRREFNLLEYMARNAGVVLSRSRLLENVWDGEMGVDSRTVDVHVRRLRVCLGERPDRPIYLQTVRGGGYMLRRQPGSLRPAS